MPPEKELPIGPFECDIFSPELIQRGAVNTLHSVNMTILPEGASPSFDHGEMSGSGNKFHYFVKPAIETKNPSGNPRQYVACNDKMQYFEDGTITEDKDFDDVVQGVVIFPDAVTPPNKRLIAFFGNSTTGSLAGGGHAWRNLGTDTTPWTYHVGATAIQAWLAEAYGPDGMLVTGASGQGRTTLGEWNLSKIIQGLYDGTTTNIGPAEPVGSGDWPLIGLAAVRNSFAGGTGGGAFVRNTVDKFYEPIRPLQEKLPHGLNCKVMSASENGVIYSTADGRLFEYSDGSEREITPLRHRGKPKDTQRGRISFVADHGDAIMVGYEVGTPYLKAARAAAKGVRFFTYIAAAYAEITTGVTDGKLSTPVVANMNAWGASAGDLLIVISPFPLAGIIPRVTRFPNAAANSFTAPTAYIGSGSTVSLGAVIDNTILGTSGRSLVTTGMPPAAAEPLLGWANIDAFTIVASDSLAMGGSIGTVTGYIYQWSPLTTTAMTATTTIDEIDVIPARPGLLLNDEDPPFSQDYDFSSLHDSGMLTEVYAGDRINGEYQWSNPYTLYTKGGGILVAAYTTASGATMDNGGQLLNLYGRFVQSMIAEGQTRNPRSVRYPRLCQWTTTEPGPTLALNDIQFRHSDGSLADPAAHKRIIKFEIMGEDIPPEDKLKPLVSYRTGRGWNKFATVVGPSPVVSLDTGRSGKQGGRKASVKVLYADTNQTDLWAPLIARVKITWEYVPTPTRENPPLTPARE